MEMEPISCATNFKFRRWLAFAVILAVVCALVPALLARDNRLNARAVRLVPTAGWRGQPQSPNYYWIGPDKIIYFETVSTDHILPNRWRVLPAGTAEESVASDGIKALPGDFLNAVSPNGNWIVCYDERAEKTLRSLNRPKVDRDISVPGTPTFWNLDSRALLNVIWQTDPKSSGKMRGVGRWTYVDGRKPTEFVIPPELGNRSWTGGVIGVLPGGKVMFVRDSSSGRLFRPPWTGTMFGEMDTAHPAAPPRVWTVPRQKDVVDASVVLSDRGDCLFWILERQVTTPLDVLLRRFTPKMRAGTDYRVSWCVSRLDGSGMREAAYYDTPNADEIDRRELSPVLTPDDRNVSFVRDGWLCIVPVN